MPSPTSTSSPPRLYFGYGSNLSLAQMSLRCPTSSYFGFGSLPNYRWIISSRGYANVVKSSPSEGTADVVYGMLYTLQPEDEARLDLAEGVPYSYVKFLLPIELVGSKEGEDGGRGPQKDAGAEREIVPALVYVDLKRTEDGVCREEYVARMNRGIRDAVAKGMSGEYVRKVLRKWVPEEEVPEEGIRDPFAPELLGGS